MLTRIVQWLRGIPIWLRIRGGTILIVVVCGILFAMGSIAAWSAATRPFPCVDGEPGSSAIFRNAGTRLFIFPESASNIESDCTAFRSASIRVWFEMDAGDLDTLIDSMRWDVRPLTSVTEPPYFGNPRPNTTYVYGEYADNLEGVSVWIDTSQTPYRVYLYAWLD